MKGTGSYVPVGNEKNGFSVQTIYESLLKEYDKEMADIVFNMYFEHYHHLDIIDNGLYDCYNLDYVERAQADADKIHAELDFVPGSYALSFYSYKSSCSFTSLLSAMHCFKATIIFSASSGFAR